MSLRVKQGPKGDGSAVELDSRIEVYGFSTLDCEGMSSLHSSAGHRGLS